MSTPLIAAITAPFVPKSRVRWYIRCHSGSTCSGSAPSSSGSSAASTIAAEICGGCSPWQSASPQPLTPSSVRTSTSVAPRDPTQPCEKANGCASGETSA
jgi:hypothetical protein